MRKMILVGVMMSVAGTAGAIQSASNMSYQGKLLDSNGIPINSSGLQMIFNIYNAATGGTSLWNETIPSVPVSNGVFSVQLGNVIPGSLTPQVFASSPTYLGVAVGGDSEMTPRQLLSASPYAFSAAQLVSNNAIMINAGVAYATFTAAGNLQLPLGISAANATLSSTVTVNGQDADTGYSLQLSSGILMTNGTVSANIVTASSGIFTYVEVAGGAGGSHLRSTQAAVPAAAQTAACDASVALAVEGTDMAGAVAYTNGATVGKCVITVTFNEAYEIAPIAVLLTAANPASITVQPYISAIAVGSFTMTYNVNSVDSSAYKFYYVVIE